MAVVREELRRADAFRASQEAARAGNWCEALGDDDVASTFFVDYSHYVKLCVPNEPTRNAKKANAARPPPSGPSQWAVLVQSLLRRLVRNLEEKLGQVATPRPLPRSFAGSDNLSFYVGLQFAAPAPPVEVDGDEGGVEDEDEAAALRFGTSPASSPRSGGDSNAAAATDEAAAAVRHARSLRNVLRGEAEPHLTRCLVSRPARQCSPRLRKYRRSPCSKPRKDSGARTPRWPPATARAHLCVAQGSRVDDSLWVCGREGGSRASRQHGCSRVKFGMTHCLRM